MARNVGLISCSEEAEIFVKKLRQIGYLVKALWTPVCEQSLQLAAQQDIPFAADEPDEVVLRKDVELLVVNCAPLLRSRLVTNALGIGKHVLCAAPVALTAPAARQLLHAALYYPQLHARPAFACRLWPSIRRMRSALTSLALGAPLVCQVNFRCSPLTTADNYDWTWERETGGGLLNVLGGQLIDALHFVLGRKISRVQSLVCKLRSSTKSDYYNRPDLIHRRSANAEDFVSFLAQCQTGAGSAEGNAPDVSITVTMNSTPHAVFRRRTRYSNHASSEPNRGETKNNFHATIDNDDDDARRPHFNNGAAGSTDFTENTTRTLSSGELTDNHSSFVCDHEIAIYGPCGRILYKNGLLLLPGDDGEPDVPPPDSVSPDAPATNSVDFCRGPNDSFLNPFGGGALLDLCRNERFGTVPKEDLADFSSAVYVRSVIDAVIKSHSSGGWVEVDYFQQEEGIGDRDG